MINISNFTAANIWEFRTQGNEPLMVAVDLIDEFVSQYVG